MEMDRYDQQIQNLASEIISLHRTDAGKTLAYCQKIIARGEEKKDPELLGFGYFYISESAYFSNNLDQFFEYATKALPYLDQANDWELTASCYNLFGIWAMNKGNFPLAQDYYFNSLKYCRQYHLVEVWIKVSVNLGVLNNICGRYEDSRVYLEEALNYINLSCRDYANYHDYVIAIYENLGTCFTMLGQYGAAADVIKTIHEIHWDHIAMEDKLLCLCMEAIYYNRIEDFEQRDSCILSIQSSLSDKNVTIMDMFEDYYLYAQMLIEANKEEEFRHLITTMDRLITSCSLVRMKLHIEDLKLRYYKKHSRTDKYLEHAAVYYELTRLLDEETRLVMSDSLKLRKNLEEANIEKTKMETQNRLLLLRSETDPLTGLYNRFRMDSYTEKLFSECYASKTPVTVEILDIDYFKQYNDNYGHQSGDGCLVKVADVLKQVSEKYHAFCARYGGDEFIMIYSGLSKEETVQAAADIKKGILDLHLEHKYSKNAPCVTVSQGLCRSVPRKKSRMWDFLHAADKYLYKVKSISRNSYCIGELKDNCGILMETSD